MGKIYLIDDNIDGNRSKYGGAFVDEGKYNDVLCAINKLSENDDLSFVVNDSVCVLMHKTFNDFYNGSYHDDSQKVAAKINDMPEMGISIPFVTFSDGDSSNIGTYEDNTPNRVYNLNKRAFYNRLDSFISYYITTSKIDLRILAYGKDFKKVLVEKAATVLFSRIQEFKEDEMVPTIVHCHEMRQIVDLSQPKIGKSYEDIINELQLNPITIREFKNRINNILDNFQDYGQNYYIWK